MPAWCITDVRKSDRADHRLRRRLAIKPAAFTHQACPQAGICSSGSAGFWKTGGCASNWPPAPHSTHACDRRDCWCREQHWFLSEQLIGRLETQCRPQGCVQASTCSAEAVGQGVRYLSCHEHTQAAGTSPFLADDQQLLVRWDACQVADVASEVPQAVGCSLQHQLYQARSECNMSEASCAAADCRPG